MSDENENIFSLCGDDLPQSIKDQLIESPSKKLDDKVFSLFQIADRLSINDVIVGLYRQYGIELTRPEANARLYRLTKRRLIFSLKKGIWELRPKEVQK